MKKLKTVLTNEKGQGMVEYILLLVGVVALVVAFKKQIGAAISGKTSDLGNQIQGFSGDE